MLELRGITKSYTTATLTQRALDGVNLAFRDSEFVAILGQSGSGKTTMLNIIGGLDHFDSGDLLIDSISTRGYKDRDWDAYRNNRIGFVFQSYNLIAHQSVLENVELALALSGVSKKERQRRALEALTRVGLADHVGKRPSQLSGGQMQRVAIARALVNDPEIVLADEPTGALDSRTSVQIMDLLREVARDRLVIMVTHNPQLAREYATRIVELADGRILSDSNPYIPGTQDGRAARPAKRTSMPLLTALSLSGKNLATKKGRTLMTSFAGSIGIIGIAAILALANGVNDYIAKTEEEALTSYPLTITKEAFDMSSLMGVDTAEALSVTAEPGTVVGRPEFTMMSQSRSSNDLKSLKAFFDKDGGNISRYVAAIEYSYGVKPLIYSEDTTDGVVQLNPEQAFKAFTASAQMGASFSTTMSQIDAFSQLPENDDLYKDAYTVLAGSWPRNSHEAVLIVDSEGVMTDLLEYTLGLKPHSELDDFMDSYYSGNEASESKDSATSSTGGEDKQPKAAIYQYDDIVGHSFALLYAPQLYTYDKERQVWLDRSDDEAYLKGLISQAEKLTISGIVAAKEDDKSILGQGIAYSSELTDEIIDNAASSQIVKEQIANPKVDVFSGKKFSELDDANTGFDMSSMFSIDANALSAAFSFDPNALQMDLGNLDFSSMGSGALDPSAMNMPALDPSALPPMDLSSVLDPSQLSFDGVDFSQLAQLYPSLAAVDWQAIIAKALDGGVVSPTAGQALAAAAADIAEGFAQYYAAHADTDSDGIPDADPQALAQEYMALPEVQEALANATSSAGDVIDTAAVEERLKEALAGDPAVQQLAADASALLAQTIGQQLSEQLGQALTQQIGQALSQYMTTVMTQAMSQMMQQVTSAITQYVQQAMGSLSSAFSSAFAINESAFAKAFQMNMEPEDLQRLLSAMMTTTPTSYEANLEKLGWADKASPALISIYPTTFADKDQVENIIETYNDDARAADEESRVITYTDIVGLLMTSVTRIIDIIKWMLVAFVSISLIVSSIMIAIITLISVLERKKEIGILRAIGASKKDISRVFNAETFIVGFLAGLIGVGVTLIFAALTNVLVKAAFDVDNIAQLPVVAGVVLILISVGLTLIAGIVPARKAAKEDPVEALRSE